MPTHQPTHHHNPTPSPGVRVTSGPVSQAPTPPVGSGEPAETSTPPTSGELAASETPTPPAQKSAPGEPVGSGEPAETSTPPTSGELAASETPTPLAEATSRGPIVALVPSPHGVEALAAVDGVTPLLYDVRAAPPEGAEAAEVMVIPSRPVDRVLALIDRLPALRLVQTLSAGTDTWTGRLPAHVTLSNARGAHGPAVAEWAAATLLAVARDLPAFAADQAAARWNPHVAESLWDRRVLILGAGDLGTQLRARLEPFGPRITMMARRARPGVVPMSDLPEVLPTQDVVALMVPLTPDTHHLADKDFLAAMKDGAILLNAARGPVVDTQALLAETRTGRLRAILDVTDPEPLPPDHPLWHAPGVLITPHVAGDVPQSDTRAWQVAADQIAQYARGEQPANTVT
ncbi:NAD(P)-dependent oxidoreductase [Nonomuraea sp. NPDC048826]|uniref:2-hydroxyacid dehydrogenase n=1 Tax=Nonomuraea sp. NPDC048826 TaxID=3364347 RepID=UPI00371AFA47